MCGCDRSRGFRCESCGRRDKSMESVLRRVHPAFVREKPKKPDPVMPLSPADYIAHIRNGTD